MSTKVTVRVVIDITTSSVYGDDWKIKECQRTGRDDAQSAAEQMCRDVKSCTARLISVGDVVTVTIVPEKP